MKIVKKIKLTLVLLFSLSLASHAQDCADFLLYRKAVPPYSLNSLTKTANCTQGKTYKLLLPLSAGKDYKILFYAAPVFDHKIDFKIIDKSTGKVLIDRPGESIDGESALRESLVGDKMVKPYFEFHPLTTMKLEVIIDVNEATEGAPLSGCIGVYILDKLADKKGFSK